MDSNESRKRVRVSHQVQSEILSGNMIVVNKNTGEVIPEEALTKSYNINGTMSYDRFTIVNEEFNLEWMELLGRTDYARMRSLTRYISKIGSVDIEKWGIDMGFKKRTIEPIVTKFKKYGIIKKLVYIKNPIWFFNPYVAMQKKVMPGGLIREFYEKTEKYLIPKEVLDTMVRDL